jgi:hypothetical protein
MSLKPSTWCYLLALLFVVSTIIGCIVINKHEAYTGIVMAVILLGGLGAAITLGLIGENLERRQIDTFSILFSRGCEPAGYETA